MFKKRIWKHILIGFAWAAEPGRAGGADEFH